MTVATKTKQQIVGHSTIEEIKFRQKLMKMIKAFKQKNEEIKKNTPKLLLQAKNNIQSPN